MLSVMSLVYLATIFVSQGGKESINRTDLLAVVLSPPLHHSH